MKAALAFIPSLLFNALFVFLVGVLCVKAEVYQGLIFVSPYYLGILSFTILQALGGAFFSLLLALFLLPTLQKLSPSPLGKGMRALLSVPFFLPSIVGCVALIGLFGQSGLVSTLCEAVGLPYTTFLYGIYGILLSHVFYYTPFMLQAFDKSLSFLPGEAKRLAAMLGMGSFSQFRFLYYPLLKKEIPSLFCLVFMYCVRSFTTVLIFGGTPQNTTLEVGIFQALHFEEEWQVAAQLALAQISLTLAVSLFSQRKSALFSVPPNFHLFHFKKLTFIDGIAFTSIFLLFFLPLLSMGVKGLPQFWPLCADLMLWKSLLNSLLLGFLSFFFTLVFVAPLVYTAYKFPSLSFWAGELPSKLSLIFSPLLLAFLFYTFFETTAETYSGFLLVLSGINGIVFAPSVYVLLAPAYRLQREKHDLLCAQLNIAGWGRWRFVDAHALKNALGYTWALCMIFSLGDARVIFLFNKGYFSSLTLFLYDKMRSYEFSQAAAVALFMLLFSVLILGISEKLCGKYRHA